MILRQLVDVIFNFYQSGRPKVTEQTYDRKDLRQFAVIAFANLLRQLAFKDKREQDPDSYYAYTGDLEPKEYDLPEPDARGIRRVSFKDEVIRLPKEMDIVNIYPVGSGCSDIGAGEIILLHPGEENFYQGPDFRFFQFAVQKGKGFNTYNIPPCVKKIAVERIYVDDDMEVSADLCYDVANEVLGVTLRIPGFSNRSIDNPYTTQQYALKQRLQPQQETEIQ